MRITRRMERTIRILLLKEVSLFWIICPIVLNRNTLRGTCYMCYRNWPVRHKGPRYVDHWSVTNLLAMIYWVLTSHVVLNS